MNTGRFVLGSLAVFLFIFFIEFVFHGMIMKGIYDQSAHLLRPEAEAQARFLWMILGYLIMAFGFCFIFLKGYEGKGTGEGIRYGLYVGVTFAASSSLINYAVFPYPANWIWAWVIAYPIIMMLAGALFALIYKPKK